MTVEEKYLVERFGQQAPFKVPEGYFETLTQKVMDQLPEVEQTETKATVVKLMPAWKRWAAACAVVAVLGTGTFIAFNHEGKNDAVMAQTTEAGYENMDELDMAADYMMFDDEDYYAFLAGE